MPRARSTLGCGSVAAECKRSQKRHGKFLHGVDHIEDVDLATAVHVASLACCHINTHPPTRSVPPVRAPRECGSATQRTPLACGNLTRGPVRAPYRNPADELPAPVPSRAYRGRPASVGFLTLPGRFATMPPRSASRPRVDRRRLPIGPRAFRENTGSPRSLSQQNRSETRWCTRSL